MRIGGATLLVSVAHSVVRFAQHLQARRQKLAVLSDQREGLSRGLRNELFRADEIPQYG